MTHHSPRVTRLAQPMKGSALNGSDANSARKNPRAAHSNLARSHRRYRTLAAAFALVLVVAFGFGIGSFATSTTESSESVEILDSSIPMAATPTKIATMHAVAGVGEGIDGEDRVVRVGYYQQEPAFQIGLSDGMHKSGYAYDYLQALSAVEDWTYVYSYGTYEEMLAALKRGDVDMVAGIYPEDADETIVLSNSDMGLAGDVRYLAVNAANTELAEEMNATQARILATSPYFVSTLTEKYYPSEKSNSSFTQRQLDWLAAKGSLKFGYVKSSLPISGQSESGDPIGVAGVLIEQVSAFLDIPVETVAYTNIKEMVVALKNGEIDVAFPLYSDLWVSEENNVIQTRQVMTDRSMIIYKGDYHDQLTENIGIFENGLQQDVFVSEYYPQAKVTEYATYERAFDALLAGKEGCVIGCSSVLQRYLGDHPEYEELNKAFLDLEEGFTMSVRKNDGMLAGILNVYITQMDDSAVTSAMVQFSSADRNYSLVSFIRYNAIPVIVVLVVVFAIIAFFLVRYLRRMKKFNEEEARSRAALEDALEAANAANAAKTTFLSSMSHDIRTPMNGIIGMTSIAQAHINEPKKVEECLEKVSISSQHLLALINDVLDMSKIESGETILNEEVIEVSKLIGDIIVLCEPQARAKNQEFEALVSHLAHERVIGDGLRIQQIFLNLISNAIKYTPEGGRIQIEFSEEPSVDPKRVCFKFVVEDNGVGMSKEYLPHLFEPFTRESEQANVGGEQGTGLGMAIVKNMVRMMGGDIDVESELGRGSKFTVTLFMHAYESEGERNEDLVGSSMLVVDDDEMVCESACEILAEMGIKGEWVLSGKEALAKVRARKADPAQEMYRAVLIDWKMPEMDGVATTRFIREDVGGGVPLIIISAYDWTDIENEAIEAGADGFIAKPLFKSRLLHLFDSLLAEEEHSQGGGLTEVLDEGGLEGKRALLVEDNEMNAEIAIEILGMAGLEFERAHDGIEGVEMMKASAPGYYDCILMDIQMPRMNGFEAAREIRALDREDAQTIPIFAMTADAFNDDKVEALEVGMNEHFAKPLDFPHVISVMRTYF